MISSVAFAAELATDVAVIVTAVLLVTLAWRDVGRRSSCLVGQCANGWGKRPSHAFIAGVVGKRRTKAELLSLIDCLWRGWPLSRGIETVTVTAEVCTAICIIAVTVELAFEVAVIVTVVAVGTLVGAV